MVEHGQVSVDHVDSGYKIMKTLQEKAGDLTPLPEYCMDNNRDCVDATGPAAQYRIGLTDRLESPLKHIIL